MSGAGRTSPRQGGFEIRFRGVDGARAAIDAALALPSEDLVRISTAFDRERIEQEARRIDADDALRARTLAGLTVSIKDLFDEICIITAVGSVVLNSAFAASVDAAAIARLRAARALPCGHTTMFRFPYSLVGLNSHYGLASNVRDPRGIVGGSPSGGALSVAYGLAEVSPGTNTGGSPRIPASLNGLARFQSMPDSAPRDGAFPLSGTYDGVGPLTRDIPTCAAVYVVLSTSPPGGAVPKRPRLDVVKRALLGAPDQPDAADFVRAFRCIADGDGQVVETGALRLDRFGRANKLLTAREALAIQSGRFGALETQGSQNPAHPAGADQLPRRRRFNLANLRRAGAGHRADDLRPRQPRLDGAGPRSMSRSGPGGRICRRLPRCRMRPW